MAIENLTNEVIVEIKTSTESSEVLAERYGVPVQVIDVIRATAPTFGTQFIVGGL